MQQQITRGDYLKDLITIYIDNNLQTSLTDLYTQFVFQCGEIQKQLTPAQVIKISFDEQESQLLKNINTCYLAGITVDGHKETFNGSLTFNTRGEVVFYEPPVSTVIPVSTESNCDCRGINGFFSNCTQPAVKAYFSINYVPTKLSELTNDTDFQDSVDVAESIAEHNASESAHPYIQSVIQSGTEATLAIIGDLDNLETSVKTSIVNAINSEVSDRTASVSSAISTTEAYADSIVTQATEATRAYADSITSAATSATEAYTNSVLQSATTAINTTIGEEVTARQGADNNLQGQIDALAAASDVTDIVGTYAELQAYDTQHLNNNDIIKVLSDETHDDEPSYYRFNKTAGTFSYIGSESAAYTKAQSNSIFVTQTTTINNYPLSSDITLSYSDVDALSETYETVISGNTSAIASNTSAIAANTTVISQHTTAIATNTNDISTINGKIPTDASTTNKLVSASTLSASIADFANKDLNNLSTVGTQKLRSLNAYANEGELLQDADGLAFVEKYAHSTFDVSKFTVVGSPTITNDGIASGFSNSNYLTIPDLSSYIPANSTNFEVSFAFTTGSTFADWLLLMASRRSGTYIVQGLWVEINSYGDFAFRVGNGSTQQQFVAPLSANTFYIVKFIAKNNNYYLYVNNSLVSQDTITTSIGYGTDKSLAIGNSFDIYPFNGSIDLKQFSITVDGIPVFSGNKTGVDTVKPDDYTVVGTPTISDDGIVSGFTTSDYITKTIDLNADNITIEALAKPSGVSDIVWFAYSSSLGQAIRLQLDGTNAYLVANIGGVSIIISLSDITWDTSSYYKFITNFDGGKYTLSIYKDDTLVKSGTYTSNTNVFTTCSAIYYGYVYATTMVMNGEINLNGCKIYKKGDLVYQPCLKIPYTESKTGSKIVDSVYRPRVNDMAEQFGYAPYYTLSDTDFTLPQVELYGLIGAKTLRDSYENGINKWYLYSNRDLEQQGSCTSGVEVTLAKPFADTNYVLSVPYSAKSATAFTPTQTGDWIAKGKGVL